MPAAAREILIVENDQPTAELYQRELGREYHVILCTDGQRALELLQTRTISAVILEPALNGEQGWKLLAAIKESARTAAVPVILCSTTDERRRGMSLGADAYLVKPALPVTLRDTVREVIQRD